MNYFETMYSRLLDTPWEGPTIMQGILAGEYKAFVARAIQDGGHAVALEYSKYYCLKVRSKSVVTFARLLEKAIAKFGGAPAVGFQHEREMLYIFSIDIRFTPNLSVACSWTPYAAMSAELWQTLVTKPR